MHANRVLICYLILTVFYRLISTQVDPLWSAYSFLNSGQHKAVHYQSIAPSTFTVGQTFHTAFDTGVIPNVVLSLQGIEQDAPVSGSLQVGFKVNIISSNNVNFINQVTIYGKSIFVLYYLYLGIDPSATQFYSEYMCLTFSSGNLVDTSSSSRLYEETRTLIGTSYSTFGVNQIIIIAYLGGYKTQMGTTGLHIKVNSQMMSSTQYKIMIETGGDAKILETTIFVFSFDKDRYSAPPYTRFYDLGFYEGALDTQETYQSTLQVSQFQYRNFLMGYTQFILNDTMSNKIDQHLYLNPNSYVTFYQNYYTSFIPATYEYLRAQNFHHRIRACPSGNPFYALNQNKCYSVCPSNYNQVNSNGNICEYYPICGDALVENPEQCDDGNTNDNDGCSSTCFIEILCGNGVQQVGQDCDDGNTIDQDGCSSQCVAQIICGNGIEESGQECDDGNTNNQDGCSSICQIQLICGNGVSDSGEECDDGNTNDLDGCSSTCQIQIICGNGIQESGQECDDGNTNNQDGCSSICLIQITCGNGVQQTDEECDDGNTIDQDGCSSTCQIQITCGNGIIQIGQQCDDGNYNNYDGCSSYCLLQTRCGDGIKLGRQYCDDGNTDGRDGCSQQCQIENHHICSQNIWYNGTSLCSYRQKMNLTILQVIKIENDNQLSVVMGIEAYGCYIQNLKEYFLNLQGIQVASEEDQQYRRLWDSFQKKDQVLLAESPIKLSIISIQYTEVSQYNGKVTVLLEYYQSISLDQLNKQYLKFVPSDQSNKYFHLTPEATVFESPYQSLQSLKPENKASLTLYTSDQYETSITISYLFLGLLILGYIFFLLTLIFARRFTVVPVEYLSLYQIVCFSLIGQTENELGFTSLLKYAKYLAFGGGIQIQEYGQETYSCYGGEALGLYCNGLNDINIPIWIGIICMIVGMGLTFYKKSKIQAHKTRQTMIKDENKNLSKSFIAVEEVIWELVFAIFFLMAPYIFISSLFQFLNQIITIIGIVILSIFILFSVLLWSAWFCCYPISNQLSYIHITTASNQSPITKSHYLAYYTLLTVWSIMLTTLGIYSQSVVLFTCIFWLILIFKVKIYRHRPHMLRSFINQIILLIIMAIQLAANFVDFDHQFKDESITTPSFSVAITIFVALFLLLCLNIGVTIMVYRQQVNQQQDQSELNDDAMLQEIYGSIKRSHTDDHNSKITNRKQKKEEPKQKFLKEIKELKQSFKISYVERGGNSGRSLQGKPKIEIPELRSWNIEFGNSERIMATQRNTKHKDIIYEQI